MVWYGIVLTSVGISGGHIVRHALRRVRKPNGVHMQIPVLSLGSFLTESTNDTNRIRNKKMIRVVRESWYFVPNRDNEEFGKMLNNRSNKN